QLNDANRFLDEQRENINTQINTVVKQINSYAERIQDLNQQIRVARASGNQHEPNDLLDQRDQLFAELNELVDVRGSEQDGNLNLILGSGQVLLGASNVYPLATQPAADDPRKLAVSYTLPAAAGHAPTTVEVEEHRITGGRLGGLLQYRREALDPAQNELGRVAIGIGRAINDVHGQGEDLNNNTGEDFFNMGGPRVIPHGGNDANSPNLDVRFQSIDGLSGQDYRIEVDEANNQFLVTRLPDNVQLGPLAPNQTHTLEGLEITLPDVTDVEDGDSWLIQPTRGAAGEISLAISDPAKIAAADPGTGSANGENALRLAALQSEKTLGGGAMSFNEAYSQLVNRVGVLTQQNSTALKAQESLIQQNYAAQQAVSGVNLDEEYVYLDRYQEQFRAASRLIDVSSTLFDTVLGLRA
ncbi:MAG TPA: flagellar hook-associated protein FlgK, partial [Burkholderiaceae bacterium]|nr:flagellar hook-associated protein FlgK [Burkholderiaceae bacterium]